MFKEIKFKASLIAGAAALLSGPASRRAWSA